MGNVCCKCFRLKNSDNQVMPIGQGKNSKEESTTHKGLDNMDDSVLERINKDEKHNHSKKSTIPVIMINQIKNYNETTKVSDYNNVIQQSDINDDKKVEELITVEEELIEQQMLKAKNYGYKFI